MTVDRHLSGKHFMRYEGPGGLVRLYLWTRWSWLLKLKRGREKHIKMKLLYKGVK